MESADAVGMVVSGGGPGNGESVLGMPQHGPPMQSSAAPIKAWIVQRRFMTGSSSLCIEKAISLYRQMGDLDQLSGYRALI